MGIRLPRAVIYLIAAIVIGAATGISGYVLGRESRADQVRLEDALRRSLAARNADDAVQQANTLIRIRNLCHIALRFPNKVGKPFSQSECDPMVPFGHLVTPASFENAVGGRLTFICYDLHLAHGENPSSRDIDADCQRGTRLLPSVERGLRNP
jgi:hypothetical protein